MVRAHRDIAIASPPLTCSPSMADWGVGRPRGISGAGSETPVSGFGGLQSARWAVAVGTNGAGIPISLS